MASDTPPYITRPIRTSRLKSGPPLLLMSPPYAKWRWRRSSPSELKHGPGLVDGAVGGSPGHAETVIDRLDVSEIVGGRLRNGLVATESPSGDLREPICQTAGAFDLRLQLRSFELEHDRAEAWLP